MNAKRVFLGFEVEAPWKEESFLKRRIDERVRHITVLFIGNVQNDFIENILVRISEIKNPFEIGLTGIFDEVLALPGHNPNVTAYHCRFLKDEGLVCIEEYKEKVADVLRQNGLVVKNDKDFLPHVTLCRNGFKPEDEKKPVVPLAFYISKLHLYESLGHSEYKSLWSRDYVLPFEEIEHTADLAFYIRGGDFKDLYVNAFAALGFKCCDFCKYYVKKKPESLDDVIIGLNDIIGNMDADMGSPWKAVSFQSKMMQEKDFMQWEMIVDV